jgi:hypothetical protein
MIFFIKAIVLAQVIESTAYPRGVLKTLPHYPKGPTVFPGYMRSEGTVGLEPLSLQPTGLKKMASQNDYSESTLSLINPYFAEWLVRHQTESRSHVFSAPQILLSGEIVPIGSQNTIMNLTSPPLASRHESVLFFARSNPFNQSIRAVVKYQTDCIEKRSKKSEIHPLLKEFFLLSFIHQHSSVQIVPRPFYVSPPAYMGTVKTFKTDFLLPETYRSICANSHVRYLVMERGGISMEDLISFVPDYTVPFFDAMNVLKQLFIALREIHKMGIVHGDIHRGNVVRSLENGEKILLIDFGLSRIVDPRNPLPEFPTRSPHSISVRMHFTHWQYEGFTPSFRDDVLGAIALAAYSTGGLAYLQSLNDAEARQDKDYFIRLFTGEDFFTVPGIGASVVDAQLGYLEEPSRYLIKAHLRDIQLIARSIASVNAIPPHDTLLSLVEDIIAHL